MQGIMDPASAGVKTSYTFANANERTATEHARPVGRARAGSAVPVSLHEVQSVGEHVGRRAERDLDNNTLSRSLGRKAHGYKPKSVRACEAGKRGEPGAWSLVLKGKSGTQKAGEVLAVPYTCRSWRCDCQCVRNVENLPKETRAACRCCRCTDGSIKFARLKTAFDRSPEWWSFLTLTLNQQAYRQRYREFCRKRIEAARQRGREASKTGGGATDPHEKALLKYAFSERACITAAYRELVKLWTSLSKWLRRNYGIENNVVVVEQHEKGWPHLHIALQSKKLYADLPRAGDEQAEKLYWSRTIRKHAVACGFGYIGHVGRVKNSDALTGYVVKVTGVHSELAGAAHKQQLPVNAPARFRRIRTSKGFLTPKIKSETYTGRMVKASALVVAESLEEMAVRRADRRARELGIRLAPGGEVLEDLTGVPLEGPRSVPSVIRPESVAEERRRILANRAYDELLRTKSGAQSIPCGDLDPAVLELRRSLGFSESDALFWAEYDRQRISAEGAG